MLEGIVAIVGAVAGLFLFQAFTRYSSNKNQVKLEAEVKEIEKRAAEIKTEISTREKETQDKVDAITKEQEKPITSSDLVDFFNNRKN